MVTRRIFQVALIISVLLFSSVALAQYEEEPFMEGHVGANLTLPIGHFKNDLVPDSLNAKAGWGLTFGAGYYFKSQLIIGGYFNLNSVKADQLDLHHRIFGVGLYGKYLFGSPGEQSVVPYIKVSAGLNFNKLATRVFDGTTPVFRELSYDPSPAVEFALGIHKKTNDYGAVFLEGAVMYDFTSGLKGEYQSTDYEWDENDVLVFVRAGILFNIGKGE